MGKSDAEQEGSRNLKKDFRRKERLGRRLRGLKFFYEENPEVGERGKRNTQGKESQKGHKDGGERRRTFVFCKQSGGSTGGGNTGLAHRTNL